MKRFLMLALAVSLSLAAYAQSPKDLRKAEAYVKEMQASVGLSADQASQIVKWQIKREQSKLDNRNDAKLTDNDKKNRVRDIDDLFDYRVKGILSKKQLKAYEDWKAASSARKSKSKTKAN